jgi:drug/metabolite transporter (DMT)-like permease
VGGPRRAGASGDLLGWAALLIVYVVWGSTYLAIRVVVSALPPLTTAGLRFGVAGAVVLVAVIVTGRDPRGQPPPGHRQRPGEHRRAARPVSHRPARGTMLGVAMGFIGVAAMLVPTGLDGAIDPASLVLLVLAALSWAVGSFLATRVAMPRDPFVSTAAQMLASGALLAIAGLAIGERPDTAAATSHPESVLALGYLMVFGSLVAFTAYSWLLQHWPISRVATYAYVNPVVAVILGAAILGEHITPAVLVGGAIIVLGVALVIRQESRPLDAAPRPVAALTT